MTKTKDECFLVRLITAEAELAGNMVEVFTTGDLLIHNLGNNHVKRVSYYYDDGDLPKTGFDSKRVPKDLTVWGHISTVKYLGEVLYISCYKQGWV